uniref:IMS_C domain-containing protein n=1 Tax=Hydatigena taeniaeformis TaxID=6205 RepID=A0A0R3WVW5_HYDTA
LLDEQKRIDVTLSTCKQLTCTLFTLKRLAAVQENGISVNIPTFRTIRDPRPEDKKLYLQQITKIVPNHEARMAGLAYVKGKCSSLLASKLTMPKYTSTSRCGNKDSDVNWQLR